MTGSAENNNAQEVSGKFAMIPNEILGMLNKNILTPAGTVEKIDGDDLAWWGFFFTFRYQNKPCYQTRKTISDRFDCSEKTVTRRTARLESLGLLTIETRKGTSNIFTASSVEEFLAMKTKKKVTPKGESNGEKIERQPASVTPATAAPVAGVGQPVSDIYSDQHDDVSGDHAVNHDDITIFDEKGVVTEAFINALSGDAAPNRNTDGTLQSFRYIYWVARYSQDERDGMPVRTREEYMAEARPEYVPTHLLPSDSPPSEPTLDFGEEEYEEEEFDAPC